MNICKSSHIYEVHRQFQSMTVLNSCTHRPQAKFKDLWMFLLSNKYVLKFAVLAHYVVYFTWLNPYVSL